MFAAHHLRYRSHGPFENLQALSMKQQVLAAQVQAAAQVQKGADEEPDEDDAAAQAMSEFLANEREIWSILKATKFYDSLVMNKKYGTPVPFRDWLRLLLHVDTSLSVSDLVRVFDEEDSIVAMSSVRSSPRKHQHLMN